jgi:hypothetical protein
MVGLALTTRPGGVLLSLVGAGTEDGILFGRTLVRALGVGVGYPFGQVYVQYEASELIPSVGEIFPDRSEVAFA